MLRVLPPHDSRRANRGFSFNCEHSIQVTFATDDLELYCYHELEVAFRPTDLYVNCYHDIEIGIGGIFPLNCEHDIESAFTVGQFSTHDNGRFYRIPVVVSPVSNAASWNLNDITLPIVIDDNNWPELKALIMAEATDADDFIFQDVLENVRGLHVHDYDDSTGTFYARVSFSQVNAVNQVINYLSYGLP